MGRLTTHVLDTASGLPGRQVSLSLYLVSSQGRSLLANQKTNHDGRCDSPLLEGESFKAGVYELDFEVGNYFRSLGMKLHEPAFLEVVTLRFGVNDASQHFHVPLVVTPWSYSTYRGS